MPNTSAACQECTKAHRRCDRNAPCSRCTEYSMECVYLDKKKRGPKPKDDIAKIPKEKRNKLSHECFDPQKDTHFIEFSVLSQATESQLVSKWYQHRHLTMYSVDLPKITETNATDANKFLVMSALSLTLQSERNTVLAERLMHAAENLWISKLQYATSLEDKINTGFGLSILAHYLENNGENSRAAMYHFTNYKMVASLPSVGDEVSVIGEQPLFFTSQMDANIHTLRIFALIHMAEACPEDEQVYLQKLRQYKISSMEKFVEIMHRLKTIGADELLSSLNELEGRILEERPAVALTSDEFQTVWHQNPGWVVPSCTYTFSEFAICVLRACCYVKQRNFADASLEVKRAIRRLTNIGYCKLRPFYLFVYGAAVICLMIKDSFVAQILPILHEYAPLFDGTKSSVERCIGFYNSRPHQFHPIAATTTGTLQCASSVPFKEFLPNGSSFSKIYHILERSVPSTEIDLNQLLPLDQSADEEFDVFLSLLSSNQETLNATFNVCGQSVSNANTTCQTGCLPPSADVPFELFNSNEYHFL